MFQDAFKKIFEDKKNMTISKGINTKKNECTEDSINNDVSFSENSLEDITR